MPEFEPIKTNWKIKCQVYKLDAPAAFWHESPAVIDALYNGAGPDNLPASLERILKYAGIVNASDLRTMLTELLKLFEAAFVIHDYEYNFSDKSDTGFHIANDRMLDNMKRILNADYPFWKVWSWRTRARWWSKAELAWIACEQFGRQAWED